jgi:hypothetical protein
MISNHTQKTKARSGMAQKNDFFLQPSVEAQVQVCEHQISNFFAIKAGRSQG